ncbi:MAG: hypothetical protein ACREP9_11280, partial [Candidatus Dormibacteraceae bacterium]
MNRRELMLAGMALATGPTYTCAQAVHPRGPGKPVPEPGSPPAILLNDYLPRSIYRIPVSEVKRAKYAAIDAHCHGHGPLSVGDMVKMMDAVGVERTVIFTGASTAERFREVRREYDKYPGRFDLWCLFDLRG